MVFVVDVLQFFLVFDVQGFWCWCVMVLYLMCNGFCDWFVMVLYLILNGFGGWCAMVLLLMCNGLNLYLMLNGFGGWCVMVLLLMYNGFIVVDMQKFLYLMFDGFGSWCVMVLYLMFDGFGGWCSMVLLLMCNDFVVDVQCFCCWCAMFCLFVDLSFPWSRRRLLTVIWSWQSGMTPVFSPLMSKSWGLWPSTSPRWTYPKLPLIGKS